MPRLESSQYLHHLSTESERFRAVLAECDPTSPVPSCPAWTASDLLWHLTEVQDFWAYVISHRPEPPRDYVEPERPTEHADLLDAFSDASGRLLEALTAADPAAPAWTWSVEQTVGFTYRRQALEALVHRLDAEQTAGLSSPLDPALAADGVDEVLDVMYGGSPSWGSFGPLPHYLRIDLTDTGDVLWVQLGHFTGTDPDGVDHHEDDIRVVGDPGVQPDAVISGTAACLLARLWRRGDGAETHLTGDLSMIDHFRRAIHHPID